MMVKLATEQASTSGTAITFTGIPAGTTVINVMLVGVSTNGTAIYRITLGDSGGLESSGYSGSVSFIGNGASPTVNVYAGAGFDLHPTGGAAATLVISGAWHLNLEDASDNTWTCDGSGGYHATTAAVNATAGSKATSAVLDRVSVTTAGAADTFDAGVISISYF